MKDEMKIFIAIVLALLLVAFLSPLGRARINEWRTELKRVDDATVYETQKHVEDTCRSMIASYNSDVMTYYLYKDSDNAEKQRWAEQAKMRANKTASTYNNYILENSFIWKGNVPEDIQEKLEYLN